MIRLAFILILWINPAWAIQPDEVLPDAALELRARDISAGLRCPICQNESIDESHAQIARDLRLLVRERLVAGDTDRQVVDFIVARYGEFVKLTPDAKGINLFLWLAAPLAFFGGIIGLAIMRRSKTPLVVDDLTQAEQDRLDSLLVKK